MNSGWGDPPKRYVFKIWFALLVAKVSAEEGFHSFLRPSFWSQWAGFRFLSADLSESDRMQYSDGYFILVRS
jgi:hypothetical protein